MADFSPCTLGRSDEGPPELFFPKLRGAGYNDMIDLPTLTVESLLDNLKTRFKVRASLSRAPRASGRHARSRPLTSSRARHPRPQKEMVYTYVGDIVISVNPFKNTGCVGNGIRSKYRGGSRAQLPPHVYMLVDQTCAAAL
jgi:myosin heavy subunit